MADVADIRLDSKSGLQDELARQFERAEALAMENSALRNTLQLRGETSRAQIEQEYANEQVRQMRRTGYCPCCGAESR